MSFADAPSDAGCLDVAVLGAGIAGLTIAGLPGNASPHVAVVEAAFRLFRDDGPHDHQGERPERLHYDTLNPQLGWKAPHLRRGDATQEPRSPASTGRRPSHARTTAASRAGRFGVDRSEPLVEALALRMSSARHSGPAWSSHMCIPFGSCRACFGGGY
jgi:hypothetical protein